jgi:hypothetical protein
MNREDLRIAFGNALGKFARDVMRTKFSPEHKFHMYKLGLKFLTYIFDELGISKQDMVYKIRSLDDYLD